MAILEGVIAGVLTKGATSEVAKVHDYIREYFRSDDPIATSFDELLSEQIEERAEEINSYALGNVSSHWSVITENIDIYQKTFNSEEEAIDWITEEIDSHKSVDLDEDDLRELRSILAQEYATAVSTFYDQVADDEELQRRFQNDLGIKLLDELDDVRRTLERIADPSAYKIFEFPIQRGEIIDKLLPGDPIPFVDRQEVPENPEPGRQVILGPVGSGKTRIIAETIRRLPEDSVDYVVIPEQRFLSQEDARALGRRSFDGNLLLVWEDLHKVEKAGEGNIVKRTLAELRTALSPDQDFYTLLEARSGRLDDIPGRLPQDFDNDDSFWSDYEPLQVNVVEKETLQGIINNQIQNTGKVSLRRDALAALIKRTIDSKSAPQYIQTAITTAEDELTVQDIENLPKDVARIWSQKPYPKLRENSPSEWHILVAMRTLYDLHIPAFSKLVYEIYLDYLGGDLSLFKSAVNSLVDRQWLTIAGERQLSTASTYYVHDTQLEAISFDVENRAEPLSNLLLDKIEGAVPSDVREGLHLYIGGSFYELEKFSLTKDHWEAAVEIGEYSVSYYNYACILSEKFDKHEEAATFFKKAIEADPEYTEAHSNYAVLLMNELDKIDEAADHFETALNIDDQYIHAHINYGILLRKARKEFKKAEEHFQKAIDLNPREPEAHYQYGRLLHEHLDKPEEAGKHFEVAFNLDPEYAERRSKLVQYMRKYPEVAPIETKKEKTSQKPTGVKFDTNLPPNTSIEATVMQDMTGDGEADNQQSIQLRDGKHVYRLDQFEEGGVQVWTKLLLKSEGGQFSPSLESYGLYVSNPDS